MTETETSGEAVWVPVQGEAVAGGSDLVNSFTGKRNFLLFSIFITASCALVYELLIASLCSYFLGDSVRYFSLVIGIFIFAMGAGSFLSRFIDSDLLNCFFKIELLLGIVGGLSIPLLYAAFAWTRFFAAPALFLTFVIGTLIGFEIPLVIREMSAQTQEKKNISNILSMDYLGGLAATLLFPFFFVPVLGLYKTSLLTGLVNLSVGTVGITIFSGVRGAEKKITLPSVLTALFFILMLSSLVMSKKLIGFWESSLYKDNVVISEQTRYQKVVVTADRQDIRLYLDGNLQFSSLDEYRYHEALIHIPMGLAETRDDILLLGAGDGLAVREILKYGDVKTITVVDLDKRVTELAKRNRIFTEINRGSFSDPRVRVINNDAFTYLNGKGKSYDLIFSDLPDPNNLSLAKLYSREFYRLALRRMKEGGIFTAQSTSPYYSKNAFWCIKQSLEAAGLKNTYPYHINVPSFGEWGFVMGSKSPIDLKNFDLQVETRFLTENISRFFYFDKDIQEIPLRVSSLDRPTVLSYYLDGWDQYK